MVLLGVGGGSSPGSLPVGLSLGTGFLEGLSELGVSFLFLENALGDNSSATEGLDRRDITYFFAI